jgi:hypothetical protein
MQPAEVAYEMLQQLPHNMFIGAGAQRPGVNTLMPSVDNLGETAGARELLLSYLQEIKTQFTSQASIDNKVYADCKAIRDKIEQNPAFEMMMNA